MLAVIHGSRCVSALSPWEDRKLSLRPPVGLSESDFPNLFIQSRNSASTHEYSEICHPRKKRNEDTSCCLDGISPSTGARIFTAPIFSQMRDCEQSKLVLILPTTRTRTRTRTNVSPIRVWIVLNTPYTFQEIFRYVNAMRSFVSCSLTSVIIPFQVKFSELTLDMFRMLQALEREPEDAPSRTLVTSTEVDENPDDKVSHTWLH